MDETTAEFRRAESPVSQRRLWASFAKRIAGNLIVLFGFVAVLWLYLIPKLETIDEPPGSIQSQSSAIEENRVCGVSDIDRGGECFNFCFHANFSLPSLLSRFPFPVTQ